MLSAVAARRASCALRGPRTPTLPIRSIAFSAHPRPLQPQSPLRNSKIYTQLQSQSPIIPRHALNLSLQTRSISNLQRLRIELKQGSKGIWRKHPFVLPFAIFCLVVVVSLFSHAVYLEVTRTQPQIAKYPAPVGKELRKAIYFTEVNFQPKKALQHYQEALKLAPENGMHPFSNEVVGIKIKAAEMLEQAGATHQAIRTLEVLRDNLVTWVTKGRAEAARQEERLAEQEKVIQELKAKKAATKPKSVTAAVPELTIDNPEVIERYERMKELAKWEDNQRYENLKRAVGISIQLGELCEHRDVQDTKKAEAAREKAVDLSLKELAYRQSKGLSIKGIGSASDDEARDSDIPYVTSTEAAIALNTLGRHYRDHNNSDLAVAVLLRSLELVRLDEGGEPTCRQVDVMSEITTTMSLRADEEFRTEDPENSRNEYLNHAVQWGQKAIYMDESIPADKKDSLCHASCVMVLFNLGEMAFMQGKKKEAEKWFNKAREAADVRLTGDEPGVKELRVALLEAFDNMDKKR
ncbi:hypothetical protein BDV19DRAFT_253420 [Aspergillus venezuelensis]